MDPNNKTPTNEFWVLSNSQDFPHDHSASTILPGVHFVFFLKISAKSLSRVLVLNCVIQLQCLHDIHGQCLPFKHTTTDIIVHISFQKRSFYLEPIFQKL